MTTRVLVLNEEGRKPVEVTLRYADGQKAKATQVLPVGGRGLSHYLEDGKYLEIKEKSS